MASSSVEELVVWHLTTLFRDEPNPRLVPESGPKDRFCLVVLNQPLDYPAILRRFWDNCPSISLSQFGYCTA